MSYCLKSSRDNQCLTEKGDLIKKYQLNPCKLTLNSVFIERYQRQYPLYSTEPKILLFPPHCQAHLSRLFSVGSCVFSGRFFVWSSYTPLPLFCLFRQNCSQPVVVFRDHSQGDITFETTDFMIRALIQPVHFECVDGGFHRGVFATQELEFRKTFSLPFSFCKTDFFRKHNKIKQFFENNYLYLCSLNLINVHRAINPSFILIFFPCLVVRG